MTGSEVLEVIRELKRLVTSEIDNRMTTFTNKYEEKTQELQHRCEKLEDEIAKLRNDYENLYITLQNFTEGRI